MLYFNVNIRHPGWWRRFEMIKLWGGSTPFKHKYWQVQVIENDNLLRVEFEWKVKQDHAGANLELGLLGYEIHVALYDSRHWDYENEAWRE